MAAKKSSGRRATKKAAAPAGGGGGLVPPEHLNPLRAAWRERQLVLFLGAGVSAPYGLANWRDLVLDLLLDESWRLQKFWPHYRKALALWMTNYHDFSLLALARVVKSMHPSPGSFLGSVRHTLYQSFNEEVFNNETTTGADGKTRTTALKTIAELALRDQDSEDGRHIPLIFTTNFDNVLELELEKAGVDAHPVYDARRRRGNKLPVVHVHGYLPKDGPIPPLDLVFTEDEYHRFNYSAFHWALTDIVNCFRNYTVLFVGHSMSDPNLRRLLDATYVSGDGIVHYLLMREQSELTEVERQKAIRFVDDHAQELGRRDGFPEVKAEDDVSKAIKGMLDDARGYNERLLRDMGVGTIPYKSYDDVPEILKKIAG